MTVRYYNRATKYNTLYNNLKRKAIKFMQYTIMVGLTYVVIVIILV